MCKKILSFHLEAFEKHGFIVSIFQKALSLLCPLVARSVLLDFVHEGNFELHLALLVLKESKVPCLRADLRNKSIYYRGNTLHNVNSVFHICPLNC